MTITDSFVLPDGAVLTPVAELPEVARRGLGSSDGDVAVSRSHSRAYSKLVDAQAAALIGEFREPSTIAAAVARFSRGRNVDPEKVLEDALPLLQSLVASGLLVSSASDSASARQPLLTRGRDVGGWTIVRGLQYLEDTEIYQVRNGSGELGALKIGRRDHAATGGMLAHEADLLSELAGAVTPRLLQSGTWESHPFLLTEWVPGADAQTACEGHRRRADGESRIRLLEITSAILRAYAELHERGIVHGDVHPRNVLVHDALTVKILDFGFSRRISEALPRHSPPRAGVSFFFDPELARALAAGTEPPGASSAGEQYSIAALLYFLLTGGYYLDFIVERDEMLRQIVDEPMTPFAKRGVAPWPQVEPLLRRALSKCPERRFSSLDDFLQAWNAIEAPAVASDTLTDYAEFLVLRGDLIAAASPSGLLARGMLPAPATSVAFGSASLAYALHRAACASDDPALFAAADRWSIRAVREVSEPTAFYTEELELSPKGIGRTSFYHGAAGVYAVEALISAARDDLRSWQTAIETYAAICRKPCDNLDLATGRAGTLLGCALLLETHDVPQLRSFGNELLADLWRRIDDRTPVSDSAKLSGLGMAHGWAGVLYATLTWSAVANVSISDSAMERLDELAACALPASPWAWCYGTAGFIFLWTQAHRVSGQTRFLELAELAARDVWEVRAAHPNLCCGLAGQAYALLNFYRHSQETIWLTRARKVTQAAAKAALRLNGLGLDSQWRPWSLYKGAAGVALLGIDLARPEDARMPLFESGA